MFIFNEFVNQWQSWGKFEIVTSLHVNITCFCNLGVNEKCDKCYLWGGRVNYLCLRTHELGQTRTLLLKVNSNGRNYNEQALIVPAKLQHCILIKEINPKQTYVT
jgi:hypothetical protein